MSETFKTPEQRAAEAHAASKIGAPQLPPVPAEPDGTTTEAREQALEWLKGLRGSVVNGAHEQVARWAGEMAEDYAVALAARDADFISTLEGQSLALAGRHQVTINAAMWSGITEGIKFTMGVLS